MKSTHENFPTRQYPYRRANGDQSQGIGDGPASQDLNANTIYRFVLGIDSFPTPFLEAEDELRDPFAVQLLLKNRFPLTLNELLRQLETVADETQRLTNVRSFLVADGGQIHWTEETSSLQRHFRIAVAATSSTNPGILVSTGTEFDSEEQFLQVLAWDSENGQYNYYERRGGTWVWAGNSYHSFDERSRGKGPFDSHVNGSLVMKELKFPWAHWHSEASAITDDVLSPNSALRREPLWSEKEGAENFERSIVRPGIERWTKARFEKAIPDRQNGVVRDWRQFMTQVFETTSVNLVASDSQSRSVQPEVEIRLPISFFLNSDAFFNLLELEPDIRPPTVKGEFYLESLGTFDFHTRQGEFRFSGDTHFAFIVPEPAFEDLSVLKQLLDEGLVSKQFSACLLMIDFFNPINSTKRTSLFKYVPENVQIIDGVCDFESTFVREVQNGVVSGTVGSPEQEFLDNWKLANWKEEFSERIERYFANIEEKLQTQSGFDDIVRLAESRRREFRKSCLLYTSPSPRD